MLTKIFLLMVFCHIIDDFVLQDKFTYLKQKSWWKKACAEDGLPYEKYKDDYKMALFEHSLEWSIAIMLPIMFFVNCPGWLLILLVTLNIIFHLLIDNMKANQLRLNLIQDQLLHFIQIIITFLFIYIGIK